MRTALPLGRRDRNGGGGSLLPQGQWVAVVRVLEPCRTQPPTCSLGPPAHRLVRGRVNWRVLRRRLVSASYLTLRLMTTTVG